MAFEKLIAPLTFDRFIQEHWKPRLPIRLIGAERERLAMNLLPSLATTLQLLDAVPVYSPSDIRFLSFDPDYESDAMEDQPVSVFPYSNPVAGRVTQAQLRKLMNQGWLARVHGIDRFSLAVSNMLVEVDQIWRGQGGAYAEVGLSPASSKQHTRVSSKPKKRTSKKMRAAQLNKKKSRMVLPPHADTDDKLVLQLEGSQTFRIFSLLKLLGAPLGSMLCLPEAHPLAYVYNLWGPRPLSVFSDVPQLEKEVPLVLEGILLPGQVLFVPRECALVVDCVSEDSLQLDVYLPPPVNWTDIMNDALEAAQKECSVELCNFSHPTAPAGSESTTVAAAILSTAARLVHQTAAAMLASPRNCLSFRNFYVPPTTIASIGDIRTRLQTSEGLLHIPNFLPDEVAHNILDTVAGIREEEWQQTRADEDATHNDISHHFLSSKCFPNSEAIFRIFRALLPDAEATLSAAKYEATDFIDIHDDRAYKLLEGQVFSRHIALVYYLTKDWTAADGGSFVDYGPHGAGATGQSREYVPTFNTLLLFEVPRWHAVQRVNSFTKARYSIFGWFLAPGRLYELQSAASNTSY